MPNRVDRQNFSEQLKPFNDWLREKGYRWPAEPWKQEELIAEFKRDQLGSQR